MCHQIYIIVGFITLQLFIFSVESLSEAKLSKNIQSNSTELQLQTYLLCDYDRHVRPYNENATDIFVAIILKSFDFDETSGTLALHSYTITSWMDPYLKWNPKEFDGIKDLLVRREQIWIPDVKTHNAVNGKEARLLVGNKPCRLRHRGDIVCMSRITHTAHCDADNTNYPYDIQKCLIQMGSWAYNISEVDLNWKSLWFVSHQREILSKPWEMMKSRKSIELETFKMDGNHHPRMYNVIISLQRKSNSIHMIHIAKAIVLMVLTLTINWLNFHSTERMIVACISFICHLICMQDLHQIIPYNGASVPLILHFYENSFLLMSFSLVLTVILRELRKTSTAPQWLTASTRLILQSKAGQLLLLVFLDPRAPIFLDTVADENVRSTKKRDSTWDYVVMLIESIVFVVVFFTYLVMLALYLPSSPSYTKL